MININDDLMTQGMNTYKKYLVYILIFMNLSAKRGDRQLKSTSFYDFFLENIELY